MSGENGFLAEKPQLALQREHVFFAVLNKEDSAKAGRFLRRTRTENGAIRFYEEMPMHAQCHLEMNHVQLIIVSMARASPPSAP